MFESNQSYRDLAFDRALARTEFKWLRNLVLTAIGSVVLSQLRTGRPMPGLVDFVVPALLFAGWEGAFFVRRRFWTGPEEMFSKQQERINELEREVYEAKAALNTKGKSKAFADALRALDTRAVDELWAVPQPLNEFESPKWLEKLDAWEEELLG